MNQNLEIEGQRIKLRKLRLSDALDVYNIMQDKEMHRYVTEIPWPYKKKDAIKWIRRNLNRARKKKKKSVTFAIALKPENQIIGAISLMHIDQKNKNAELGYWVGKKYWGKGFATEAVKLILKFAFKKLKLHRVYAYVFEENTASKKVLEKCGFKYEGLLRETYYKNNKWHSGLCYSILSTD